MKRRIFLQTAGWTAGAALAGCAGAKVRDYQLAPVAGSTHGGTGLRIGVRTIGVPSALAHSGLPQPGGIYEANSFANDVWAAPLGGMLQSTTVQNLAQRLPGDTVIASGGAIGALPDKYVEINIFNFAPDAAGKVTLTAQLATRPVATQNWQLHNFTAAATGGITPEGIAAAMSLLWGQAADVVAGMV